MKNHSCGKVWIFSGTAHYFPPIRRILIQPHLLKKVTNKITSSDSQENCDPFLPGGIGFYFEAMCNAKRI